ncbi:hypothetical protein BCR44DRAFT_122126 [Catenaria anguillulae PL171]|uniref:Fe2OG dioxygenase domain-containing protein n=1 Tax=Catenaria anguillulae PL171 TaxID=765915 RepID=A0A1Y2HQ10_9FUNG|nr:hypothetical protein BCR44DRAFT_122126 [Catenaria anguillulae PL171]
MLGISSSAAAAAVAADASLLHVPTFTDIPILNVSALIDAKASDDSAAYAKAIADLTMAMYDASKSVGFFLVSGHGIDTALIDDMFAMARRFFALPVDVKKTTSVSHNRGYMALGEENLNSDAQYDGDIKEALDIGPEKEDAPLPDDASELDRLLAYRLRQRNRWLSDDVLPGFKQVSMKYYDKVNELAEIVLEVLASAMGQSTAFFSDRVKVPGTMGQLRMVRYPAAPGMQSSRLSCGAHSDYGCITLLAADTPGLQIYLSPEVVKRHFPARACSDLQAHHESIKYASGGQPGGSWAWVPVVPGTFIVNLGDMISRWTNRTFKSTLHRVVHVDTDLGDRISLPFFVDCDFDTEIRVLPAFLPGSGKLSDPKEHVLHFPKPITMGQHLALMFSSTFPELPAVRKETQRLTPSPVVHVTLRDEDGQEHELAESAGA